ncbi:hypothetical protein GLOIN_2v1826331 [Rhizophagus irregularis DAOM 181602=DAOM 197198]|nr:hypothetical protein GLOIN_2v1826331 [Rhizophagus irregularis DAOM 181602=DAOM 197198]
MHQKRTQSWLECPTILPFKEISTIYVADNGTQTDDSIWWDSLNQALKYDHEEENNRQVMNELKILSQHLIDYNKRTFEKFMHDIEKKYREWITVNKKMHYEIKDLKMQVLEAEKRADIYKVEFYSLVRIWLGYVFPCISAK